ncbi:MAG: hypothetical protein HY550_07075 [Elusimicrobia bacterium]|nr:hypothetical protein [Elusimicrobiota bacterium]
MKKYLLAVSALIFFSPPAAAADYRQALEGLNQRLDASLFSGAALSAQNQLILEATDKYAALPASERGRRASAALAEWRKALSPRPPANLLLSIRWKDGGELWLLNTAGPVKIDEWADTRLPFAPDQPRADRFFGYVGGQYMNGTEETGNTTGFNGRLGKTFMSGRYDAAILYGYAKTGEAAGSSNYGLTGRALFPLNERMGWNLGGSYIRSVPSSGDAVNNMAALGGVNFYLPGGSLDLTVSLGNNSMYSFMAGYTLYLTRK